MTVFPATKEAEVGLQYKADPGKVRVRPYMKKKLKSKGLGAWLR
jgi:hypothetical protein